MFLKFANYFGTHNAYCPRENGKNFMADNTSNGTQSHNTDSQTKRLEDILMRRAHNFLSEPHPINAYKRHNLNLD